MKYLILIFSTISILSFMACDKDDEVFVLKSADITTVFGQDNFGAGQNGCTGGNQSPQLSWENAPDGTKSFAITMIDLNAFGPGIPFDHWMLINIPASTNSLVKDAGNISGANLPAGASHTPNGAFPDYVANADYVKAYAGVCPNVGNTNQYEITVYALNVATLNVAANATSTEVKAALQAASIGTAKMSVTASR